MQENLAIPTDIQDVLIQPLGIVPTQGGPVLHMLKQGYALEPHGEFGEIYFSEVEQHAVKAWKRHKLQTQRFAVPIGLIKIVLFDDRPSSQSRGNILELILGRPDHYNLLLIPPMVWYGFKGMEQALICNYADVPHAPDEAEKMAMDASLIPYVW